MTCNDEPSSSGNEETNGCHKSVNIIGKYAVIWRYTALLNYASFFLVLLFFLV